MANSPIFLVLGRLGNAMRRISCGGRSLELESESNGGGRETTTPNNNPRVSLATIVNDSNNPPTKSLAIADAAEVEKVEGVGAATRALACAREAAANPPNGKRLIPSILSV
jgi:hypothetical protein